VGRLRTLFFKKAGTGFIWAQSISGGHYDQWKGKWRPGSNRYRHFVIRLMPWTLYTPFYRICLLSGKNTDLVRKSGPIIIFLAYCLSNADLFYNSKFRAGSPFWRQILKIGPSRKSAPYLVCMRQRDGIYFHWPCGPGPNMVEATDDDSWKKYEWMPRFYMIKGMKFTG